MCIRYSYCIIILSLWLNIEGKFLMPACPTGQRRFLCISLQITILLYRNGITIKIIHSLFKAHPKSEISKFINAYKSASSRLLKKEFPYLREKLWKEYFWSQSFCLLTIGEASIEVIQQYIESQGEKTRGRKRGKQSVQIQNVPQ